MPHHCLPTVPSWTSFCKNQLSIIILGYYFFSFLLFLCNFHAMYFSHIYLPPQSNSQFSTHPAVHLFFLPSSIVSVALALLNKWLSSRVWSACQRPLRKSDSLSTSYQLPIAPWWDFFLLIWLDLFRSFVCYCNFCQVTDAMALLRLEITISL